jgi:TonB family protein
MIKLRHFRDNLSFLALAMVCVGGSVCAQDQVPAPNILPVIIDPRQAAKLALAQAVPEYPAIAKVNYIEGQVQVELTVDGKGTVNKAHVLQGNAILAVSALKATCRWTYHPLTTPSGPSGFITRVRLKFSLYNRGQEAELTPRQAEKDFLRQVKPPQVVRPPDDAPAGDAVHMRLLVNEQGQVVDTEAAALGKAQFDAARETLRGWTFRPAYWGNLPIASYLEVDVPTASRPSLAVAPTPPAGNY